MLTDTLHGQHCGRSDDGAESGDRVQHAAEWQVTGSASITNRDYLHAWKLGGQNTRSSYSGFVSGFTTTANDAVTILSVSGNVVTARLTAQQTDGTVKTYQGTYTVSKGVIVGFSVRQVS